MAKYWRPAHTRNGKRVKGAWVRGKNPKQGCSWWLLGMLVLAVVAAVLGLS